MRSFVDECHLIVLFYIYLHVVILLLVLWDFCVCVLAFTSSHFVIQLFKGTQQSAGARRVHVHWMNIKQKLTGLILGKKKWNMALNQKVMTSVNSILTVIEWYVLQCFGPYVYSRICMESFNQTLNSFRYSLVHLFNLFHFSVPKSSVIFFEWRFLFITIYSFYAVYKTWHLYAVQCIMCIHMNKDSEVHFN